MFILKNSKFILKTATILFPIFLGICIVEPKPALAGNFLQTCIPFGVPRLTISPTDVTLTATCRNIIGKRVVSVIKISDYITNRNGILSWSNPVGNFQQTCTGINLMISFADNSPRPILQARCGDGRGGYTATTLNLDERISNLDGVLAFDR